MKIEIKKEDIDSYLYGGYQVSQETVYFASKCEVYDDNLLIGTLTEHGIYAGIAEGKKVYVALKDEPKQLTWDKAIEACKDKGHLPTKQEFMLIYINKDIINKALADNGGEPFREDDSYWSSTETNYGYSWLLFMNSGSNYTSTKGYNTYVRAVVAL